MEQPWHRMKAEAKQIAINVSVRLIISEKGGFSAEMSLFLSRPDLARRVLRPKTRHDELWLYPNAGCRHLSDLAHVSVTLIISEKWVLNRDTFMPDPARRAQSQDRTRAVEVLSLQNHSMFLLTFRELDYF